MEEENRKLALVTGGLGEVGELMWGTFECDVYDIKNGDDIWDKAALVERMEGKDLVVHLAAYPHPFIEGVSDEEYMRLNLGGTKHVVSCMKKAGVKKLIFMSTGGLYGFSAGDPYVEYLPIDEEHPLDEGRLTAYDRSKLGCEEYLKRQRSVTAVVFRLEAPALIDQGKEVGVGHLFAHVSRDNLKELMLLAAEYDGPNVVLNAGDPTTNKFCPDTVDFAKRVYPEAEIKLESSSAPLISVDKAKEVLGYAGTSVLRL